MEGPYAVMVDEEVVNATELPISNSTHAFLYFTYFHTTHEVTIVPKLLYLYYDLLDKYTRLLTDFARLNSTYYELLDDYSLLQGNYSHLLNSYDTLNASYQEHLLDYSELQRNYTSLLTSYNSLQEQYNFLNSTLTSGQENIIKELDDIRKLMYVSTATAVIFIIATLYLATKTKVLISQEGYVDNFLISTFNLIVKVFHKLYYLLSTEGITWAWRIERRLGRW